MAINLAATIDSIFSYLQAYGMPTADRRQAGLEPAIIESKIHSLGLQAPEDLVRIYGLCDGTNTVDGDVMGRIDFFPGYYWLDLAGALTVYGAIGHDYRWNASWLPVFSNGDRDFYGVICDPASPHFGGVVGSLFGVSDCFVEFKNLTAMFEIIQRCFAEKIFFMLDGYLDGDDQKMFEISCDVQPGFAMPDA
ncbi:MAG: hypothetical protein WA840_02995 [Caulobacteraceae bacterium]